MTHDLTAARHHARCDADAAAIAWAQDRIEALEGHHKTLCSVASIEVDWLQRLVTGDEAMKQISELMTRGATK